MLRIFCTAAISAASRALQAARPGVRPLTACLILGLAVSACGGPVDPNRPPLPRDYEPPPLDHDPATDPLKRI